MKIKQLIAIMIVLLPCGKGYAQYQANWESLDKRPVPEWYRDAKFGIFIHWGVYSVPAWSPVGSYAEWYQHALVNKSYNGAVVDYHKKKYGSLTYYQLADQFKAELFDPDAWAQLIERSGAKYVVLTSKHHDGFCLWPSKEADRDWGFPWNATEVGPKKDLVGALFTALRKTDVHPGLYYSLYEWFNPLWLKDKDRYVSEHCWPQMKDLIDTYKPDVLWTDGEWDLPAERWKAQQFLAWLYNDSPVKNKIVTYDRWGSVRFNHGGVYTPEYQPDLDFGGHYFEENQGMGYSYGYNRGEDAWDYSSAQSLVLYLIDLVSRGGNFLLDIGPDADGKIPPIMQERLLQIGQWMAVNGEAIYGTSPWKVFSQWSAGNRNYVPKKKVPLLLKQTIDPDPGYAVKEMFFTHKGHNLYCIMPQYPADNKAVIRQLSLKEGTKIILLGTGEQLTWTNENGNVSVSLPPYDPAKFKAPYAYVLKVEDIPDFVARPEITASNASFTAEPVLTITSATPGAAIHYTLDGTLPDETSPLYSQPFKLSQTTMVKAIAVHDNMISSNEAAEEIKKYAWMPAVKVKGLKPGINYRYYEPDTFNLAVIAHSVPVKTGVTSVFSSSEKRREAKFCFAFDGYIRIDRSGIYTFYTASDDGSKLWIDGKEVVDNDGDHGTITKAGKVALKAGYHAIRVDYYDNGGGNNLEVSMQPEGGKKEDIAATLLYHR